MRNIRLIPRLDVKKNWLIKGVQMEGWRKIGDPADAAISYSKQGADEIIFLDVVASLYKRNNLIEIVKKVASSVFIPLTVGGGIRTIDDVRSLLSNGADKITLNTAAIENPSLISEISDVVGSQATVISIEAVRNQFGEWEAMTDNGRNKTNKEVVLWAIDGGTKRIVMLLEEAEVVARRKRKELLNIVLFCLFDSELFIN